MIYLPFLTAGYSVAPALTPLKKAEQLYDKLIFQIDKDYGAYLQNKEECRSEDIHKYYYEESMSTETTVAVNRFLVNQFLCEHPEKFGLVREDDFFHFKNNYNREQFSWNEDWIKTTDNKYTSLFDALVSQVQEDVAVCQLEGDQDTLAALHVCTPNHWSPATKIGKPFDAVHAVVPGMKKTFTHYFKMLLSAVNKGPFTRFAWGIATDTRLNHHPDPPTNINDKIWQGRRPGESGELYVRVERQNLVGLPEVNAFLFTIRTYFYPVAKLGRTERRALFAAIESMSEESLAYKGLTGQVELLKKLILRD